MVLVMIPFKPTDGPPEATAANAYSICTSLPEGLKKTKHNMFINLLLFFIHWVK